MHGASRVSASEILGNSPAIVKLRAEIAELAQRGFRSVLVTGESGTGKELVARALHREARVEGLLETFNCPAVPADHLEAELFGTRRGAYPGAVDRSGAAERAAGGLLFLDEVAAMAGAHQAKVLRLLESGEARRLGGTRAQSLSLRIVAATNEDLGEAVRRGTFREDLYYRLVHDGVVQVPPLRQRLEDLDVLAAHFVGDLNISLPALARLGCWTWPGNVRELRAVVTTAARLESGAVLGVEAVDDALARIGMQSAPEPSRAATETGPIAFDAATARLRRRLLVDALADAQGNQTLAGMLLGLHARRGEDSPSSDLRARKLAHRKFAYWWARLVDEPLPARSSASAPSSTPHATP